MGQLDMSMYLKKLKIRYFKANRKGKSQILEEFCATSGRHRKHRLCGTKPGSLLRKQIPIKTNQWTEDRPGFIEADTVAHCGTSLMGRSLFYFLRMSIGFNPRVSNHS